MHEFTKKEIRTKFKKTKYGKKTNKMLYTSLVVTILLFVIEFVLGFIDGATGAEMTKTTEIVLNIIDGIFLGSLAIVCYFDGKRDGAITQFEKDLRR